MGRKPKPKQITDKTMEPTAVCSEVTYIKNKSEKENETEQVFWKWSPIIPNSDFITSTDFNSLFSGGVEFWEWTIGDGNDED